MPSRLVTQPVYQQLNSLLREMIATGEFGSGDKFPAEREICERFNVSRATANKAVSNLVAEGILVFKKGVGTFVGEGRLDYDLAHLVSFTDKARAAGMAPSTQILAFETLPASAAPEDTRSRLGITPQEGLYRIERLRLADDTPVILERRFLVAKFCPGLTEEELQGSLYQLWSEKYNLEVAGADQTIRAIAIPDADAKRLDVPKGSPGLLVESVGILRGDVPLWHEMTLYRADRYEFHNCLGPISRAVPAVGKFITQSASSGGGGE